MSFIQKTNQNLLSSAFRFLSGTLLSRFTGLARDLSMAFYFGADASIAAFLVAFRLASLFRRIFGEGALLNGFIPHFEEQKKENPKKAAEFFRDGAFSLFVILFFVIIGLELFLTFWDFNSPENQIISLYIKNILPGVLFICLFGIFSGLLHCEKWFFVTGIAPVAFNLFWIGSVLFFKNEPLETAVFNLSIAISIAFISQWLLVAPFTVTFLSKHLSWKEFFAPKFFSFEVKKMFYSVSLGVVGVISSQLNSAIDTFFSRYAALEGPAYLNYAIHLQQLPLALFGISIAAAFLPAITKAIQSKEETKDLLEYALSKALFLSMPSAFAIFSIGYSSINLLYGRGHFSEMAVVETAKCLHGYGVGLVPMVMTLIMAPVFYAKKDFITPVKGSMAAILINIILNSTFVLLFNLGPASLAYSTSVSAIWNALFLVYYLFKKLNIRFSSYFLIENAKVLSASFLSALATMTMSAFVFKQVLSRKWIVQCSHFGFEVGVFFIVFLFSLLVIKGKKVVQVRGILDL